MHKIVDTGKCLIIMKKADNLFYEIDILLYYEWTNYWSSEYYSRKEKG